MTHQHAEHLPVLSIDAWRDDCGWYWNNQHKVGTLPASAADLSDRRLLRLMREEGFLGVHSAGKVYLERDDDYITVCDRGTREPLIAIDVAFSQDFVSLYK